MVFPAFRHPDPGINIQLPPEEHQVVHYGQFIVSAVGSVLFAEFGKEELVRFFLSGRVVEVAAGQDEGQGVFQQVVATEVVLPLPPQINVLPGDGSLNPGRYGPAGDAVKLQPVHQPEAGGIRFPTVLMGVFAGDPGTNELFSGVRVEAGLAEVLEVVQVVGPQFTFGGVVPVDGTVGRKTDRPVQKTKPCFGIADGESGSRGLQVIGKEGKYGVLTGIPLHLRPRPVGREPAGQPVEELVGDLAGAEMTDGVVQSDSLVVR